MKLKFLICKKCGNIVGIVRESGIPIMCCGEKMEKIIPGSIKASKEKHIPIYKRQDDKVIINIGETEHPMTDDHHIEWVSIQTKFGNQRKPLKLGDKPEACFAICEGDEVEVVYAFCNIHGLWKGVMDK